MHRPIFLVLPLLAGLTAQPQKPAATRVPPPELAAFLDGLKLNQDQALVVEKTVAKSPDDVNARLELLGHYSLVKNGDGKNGDKDFEKHLLWLVDHHPESSIFGIGIIELYWHPSATFMNEYGKHWEQAAVAHPNDSAVLSHAAAGVSANDFNLGLAYARKSVEADANCTRCRSLLGSFIGSAILRLPGKLDGAWKCLPNTPSMQQTVSNLRKETELSSDPEMILSAGMLIKGYSGVYGSRCGGDSAGAAHFGGELIRKAVSLDPSLVDRYHLQNVINSIH